MCGGTTFVDATDNTGQRYRGCSACTVTSQLPHARIEINFARATVAECLDCVSARINECQERGVEPDHITNIAWRMLVEALR